MIRLILILASLLPTILFGQSAAVEHFLSSEGLRSASVALSVRRLSDGARVVEYNSQKSLRLASVTKLFPTWLALDAYGTEFRYESRVVGRGEVVRGVLKGDLVIEACGDPTFNSRYFPRRDVVEQIVAMVKRGGISKVEGRIVVDGNDSVAQIPGSWVWEDIANYYAARPHALNFLDNSYTIEFCSGAVGELTEIKKTYYKPQNIELINQVVASKSSADNAWIYGCPYSDRAYIMGSIPSNRASFKIRGATHHPEEVFLSELRRECREQGVEVCDAEIAAGSEAEIGVIESPTLLEIAKVTNKVSCNLFAEALGELLARGSDIKSLLQERGVEMEAVDLKDASGLSPQSVASAATITDLLLLIDQSGEGENFRATLPKCGVDRALNAFSTPELESNLLAKTGSMAGVQALAGYLNTESGEELAFCVIVNYYTCSRANLQRAITQLLLELR